MRHPLVAIYRGRRWNARQEDSKTLHLDVGEKREAKRTRAIDIFSLLYLFLILFLNFLRYGRRSPELPRKRYLKWESSELLPTNARGREGGWVLALGEMRRGWHIAHVWEGCLSRGRHDEHVGEILTVHGWGMWCTCPQPNQEANVVGYLVKFSPPLIVNHQIMRTTCLSVCLCFHEKFSILW